MSLIASGKSLVSNLCLKCLVYPIEETEIVFAPIILWIQTLLWKHSTLAPWKEIIFAMMDYPAQAFFQDWKQFFFQLYIELMDCCKSWKMSLKTRDCGKVRSKLCNWLFRQFISFEYKCRPMGVIVYIAHTLQAGHFIVSSLWWLTICLFKVTREFSKLFPKKPYCWVSSKTTLKLRSVAITLSTCFVTFI